MKIENMITESNKTGMRREPLKKSDRLVIAFVLGLGVAISSHAQQGAPAEGQQPPQTSPASQPPVSRATQTNAKPPHPFAQQLFNLGAVTCAARAHQVAGFLSDGTETFILQNPLGDPDRSFLSAAMVYSEKSKILTSFITLVPNQSNYCGATYQTINYFEENCRKVILGKDFSMEKIKPVGKSTALFMPITPTARLLIINAGKGCIVVKQEVIN